MFQSYVEGKIDVVTSVDQIKDGEIALHLKVYPKGEMWTSNAVIQLTKVVEGTYLEFTVDNPLPKILWALFPNGMPEVKKWLNANCDSGYRERIANFVEIRMAYMSDQQAKSL